MRKKPATAWRFDNGARRRPPSKTCRRTRRLRRLALASPPDHDSISSTLTFSTSRPLDWKSGPRMDVSSVLSLLTVMTGWMPFPTDSTTEGERRPWSRRGCSGRCGRTCRRRSDLVTRELRGSAGDLVGVDEEVGQLRGLRAAVPTDVEQAADRVVAVVRLDSRWRRRSAPGPWPTGVAAARSARSGRSACGKRRAAARDGVAGEPRDCDGLCVAGPRQPPCRLSW